jgi:hypothetical protein
MAHFLRKFAFKVGSCSDHNPARDGEPENGVINVALLGIIRRWTIRERISVREITGRPEISRKAVRRYIRAEAGEPSYPARHAPSSLDSFARRLSTQAGAEAVKSRKLRRTLKQMSPVLRERGDERSGDRMAAFRNQWKADQMERVDAGG